MPKTILLTGATDGIGFDAAKRLAALGHTLLLHGRNPEKLANIHKTLSAVSGVGKLETYIADLSDMSAVDALAESVMAAHSQIDVLINNAGILKTPNTLTKDNLDIRFAVNTLAPYRLTQKLLPIIPKQSGRVINLSSAAQAPVDLDALAGRTALDDMPAYSQSKLAITMWTREMAKTHKDGPLFISVNPGSLLASKMVTEGFGIAGSDIGIGGKILTRAALGPEFENRSGDYFDNDAGDFGPPHADALDDKKSAYVVQAIEDVLNALT